MSINSKIYIKLLRLTMALLIVDIFSRFDGHPGTIYSLLNYAGNFIMFLCSLFLPTLWVVYVSVQLFNDKKTIKKIVYFLLIPTNLIYGMLVIMNLFTGWFYIIDDNNIYQRGPLFLLSAGFSLLLLLFATVIVVINQKKIEVRYYFSLVFFIVPPIASIFLQIFFYGSSLILNSVVFSLLIIFLNIQQRSIYTDHLTGVYNRKMLDEYLKNKISKSTEKKSFSAIMLDLNEFKKVNDTYGHDMGDRTLQITVRLLKSSIKSNEFIARFGGDEFWLVLNSSTQEELMEVVKKINKNLAKQNESHVLAFKLGLSMGWSVYEVENPMNVEEFQKYVDELMYKNKKMLK